MKITYLVGKRRLIRRTKRRSLRHASHGRLLLSLISISLPCNPSVSNPKARDKSLLFLHSATRNPWISLPGIHGYRLFIALSSSQGRSHASSFSPGQLLLPRFRLRHRILSSIDQFSVSS